VDNRLPTIQKNLRIHDFHGEVQTLCDPSALFKEALAASVQALFKLLVSWRSAAYDLPCEILCQQAHVSFRHVPHDDADFLTARTTDDNAITTLAADRFLRLETAEVSSPSVAQQVCAICHLVATLQTPSNFLCRALFQ